MVMKYLQAKDTGTQYYYQVWLDDTKVLLDDKGERTEEPDPDWIREWRWGKDNTLVHAQRETKLLAQLELNKMNSDSTIITLSVEGKKL